ncbi:hypothetical protein JL720_1262 [Aureococcus anophagefferens]|nr:hypothetical protein JL720_1262 [Aureococcus anophagefferens]
MAAATRARALQPLRRPLLRVRARRRRERADAGDRPGGRRARARREHGFAPERARETAAAAVRVANLKRGPRPVEEKYVLWWADKYGARRCACARGAGGSDVDVDPMARVARRVHLGGRNQVPRMRLVVDESPAGLRRIAEAEAMGREDGRARHAGRQRRTRRGDRAARGRRDDALGAGLTFQQKRRVVAHLPVCDQMRLFCASRRLAVDGFGGTFWRATALRDFGASPNDGSWFGGELRAEDALKATERLRTLPAPGADGLSPDAAARARSGAAGAGYRRELCRCLASQRVWSWGGAGGALGHDDDDVTFAAPKELEALRPVPVKQLVAGPHHSAVLDWRGRVYSWGFDACLNVRQSVSAASSAGATYAEDAGPARAGDTRVRAPTRVADVFRGDLDLDDGADALRAPPPAVRHIAADSTSVWARARAPPETAAPVSWAREIARHLGLASGDLDEVLEPVPLAAAATDGARRVALEAATRVEDDAPTRSPVVFTWGLGPAVGRGREGFDRTLADGEDGRPTRVRDLEDVVWLGAGHSFTAALTFAGELYLWGDGDVLGRAAPRHRPARAAFPKGAKCVAAACGLYHVLAMTCARDADAPVNTAFYLDHRVDASEWLLHSRIRTDADGAIAPLTHARRGVRVPDVLRDLGPVELAVGHAAAEGGE